MCKQASYSKYQKKVIKFLTDFLGVETPFTYEKAQNNHLKVLIDGVDTPLFTGSTPSDSKSINNFMAEVKRQVTASRLKQKEAEAEAGSETDAPEVSQTSGQSKSPVLNLVQMSHDKIIAACIKSLRTRLDTMKSKEEALVLETKSMDEIKKFRINEIKHSITIAHQSKKLPIYFKPKDMKAIENKILQHLDYWMPTLACYSSLLNNKKKYQKKDLMPYVSESKIANNVLEFEPEITEKLVANSKTKDVRVSQVFKKSQQDVQEKSCITTELMSMSSNARIALLRNLARVDALQLIDDINEALAINREQDIMEVVNMIKEKGLPLEAIISRIDVV